MAYTKNGVTTMFQYDNAGNLLVDDKAQYSYDAFNRTTRVETFDGNVQVNRYDAEGLRYEMEENGNLVQFIFNQEREAITEEDSAGLIRLIRSTELIARSSDSARTYYHYASDEMGSATHIVDDAGAVQNRYEYDAWGNLTVQEEAVPNRFTYYGQQIDPITQQYYLRARFYNPVIGRFTQEDTYRGDGLNLYAYCANNPVYYVDPTGHYSDCVKIAYDRIRRENPKLPIKEAYQKALQETGFDKLSKEDNRRRSEAANLNRQLKDPNLTPEQREEIFKKLDEINNEFSGSNQPSTPRSETPKGSDQYNEYWLKVAERISNEALDKQIKFIKNGGITKPGGGAYKPAKISATVDLNSGDIYFGYNGAKKFNPSRMEINPILQKRIDYTKNLASNATNNPFANKQSFEMWSVDNCAEIYSANKALSNNVSWNDMFINTKYFASGIWAEPCNNCKITFENVYMPKKGE